MEIIFPPLGPPCLRVVGACAKHYHKHPSCGQVSKEWVLGPCPPLPRIGGDRWKTHTGRGKACWHPWARHSLETPSLSVAWVNQLALDRRAVSGQEVSTVICGHRTWSVSPELGLQGACRAKRWVLGVERGARGVATAWTLFPLNSLRSPLWSTSIC